jgi:hypothetical protein
MEQRLTASRVAVIERSIDAFNHEDSMPPSPRCPPMSSSCRWRSRPTPRPCTPEALRKFLAEVTFRNRGAGSGIEIAKDAYMVCRFDGEQISRIELFLDEARAREAAGLD